MAIIVKITDLGTSKFTFEKNGVVKTKPKNYNATETTNSKIRVEEIGTELSDLFSPLHFSEIEIDGVVYGSASDTVFELNKVIYTNITDAIPTNVSELNNDVPYLVSSDLPTNTSSLVNDGEVAGDGDRFILESEIPPTEIKIKDEYGVIQITGDEFTLKSGEFDQTAKSYRPHKTSLRKVFLSQDGSDTDFEPENIERPFKTMNALCTWMLAQPHKGYGWTIYPLDNGVYFYDLSLNATTPNSFDGFNITNENGAMIEIRQGLDIEKQHVLYMPTGKLSFYITDDYIASYRACLLYNGFNNLQTSIYVKEVEIKNISVAQTNIWRGIYRTLGTVERFIWEKTTLYEGACRITDAGATNKKRLVFGEIINNNNSNNTAKHIFSYNTAEPIKARIHKYTSNSVSSHPYLYGDLELGDITSNNVTMFIDAFNIKLLKNSLWQNVKLAGVILNKPKIFDGNNKIITLDNNLSNGYFYYDSGNSRHTKTGFDETNLLVKNATFLVPSSSLFTSIFSIDLRTGRVGGQVIVDNVTFDLQNNGKPFVFVNWLLNDVSHNIIFRNSIRIFNGTDLVSGTAPVGSLQNILVSENASIFHDNGTIGGGANFQDEIFNIDTYHKLTIGNNTLDEEFDVETHNKLSFENAEFSASEKKVILPIATPHISAVRFDEVPTNANNIIQEVYGYNFDSYTKFEIIQNTPTGSASLITSTEIVSPTVAKITLTTGSVVGIINLTVKNANKYGNEVSFNEENISLFVPEQNGIVWTDISPLVEVGDGFVQTITTSASWNKQALINASIPANTDGYLEFTHAGDGVNGLVYIPIGMVGLNSDPLANSSYTTLDYALYLTSRTYIYENSSNKGEKAGLNVGDVFRIERIAGVVKYYRNDVLIYTSAINTNAELFFDCSLYRNIKIENIKLVIL